MNIFLEVAAGLLFIGSMIGYIWGIIIQKRGIRKKLNVAARAIETIKSGNLITLMLMYRISTSNIPEADRKIKIAGWLFAIGLLLTVILFFKLLIF